MQKVDQVLLQNDSGVESALLYAKAWSKYAKDVLSWVEKRLNMGQSLTHAHAHTHVRTYVCTYILTAKSFNNLIYYTT